MGLRPQHVYSFSFPQHYRPPFHALVTLSRIGPSLFPSASSKDVRADSGRSHTTSDSGRRRESSSDICRRAFVLNMFIPFLFLGTTALLSTLWSLCRALAPFYMFHLQLGILLQNNEWLARYISHTNSKVFFVNSKND